MFRASLRFPHGGGKRKFTMDPSPQGQVVRESVIFSDEESEPKEVEIRSILLKDGNDVAVIYDDINSRREYKFTHVSSEKEKTE